MRCNRCGNENPPLHRFCGMCGASLLAGSETPATPSAAFKGDAARTSAASPSPLRNGMVRDEPVRNESPPVPARVETSVAARVDTRLPDIRPAETRFSEPRSDEQRFAEQRSVEQRSGEFRSAESANYDDSPIISGPSFLGLNRPNPAATNYGRNSIFGLDQDSGKSHRRLDYLLEDEEQPKRGTGKAIAILLALLLCVGLGYARWRTGGFAWLTAVKKSITQTTGQTSTSSQTDNAQQAPAADSGANGNAANGTPPGTESSSPANGGTASTDASSQPASQTTGAPPPAADAASSNSGSSNSGSNNTGSNNSSNGGSATQTATTPPGAADNSSGTSTGAAGSAANQAASSQPEPTQAGSTQSGSSQPRSNTAEPRVSSDTADADASTSNSKAEPLTKPAAGRPSARGGRSAATTRGDSAEDSTPPADTPSRTVVEAERYIYGRGVAQDCDRGLKMLRTTAYQSNTQAMISLGALYSTGLCAPRDLPTAYRWFAVALRKQPDNQPLQQNLQKLWSQMTQPERQLAIKLSQ